MLIGEKMSVIWHKTVFQRVPRGDNRVPDLTVKSKKQVSDRGSVQN
jgi:hypothetical protein